MNVVALELCVCVLVETEKINSQGIMALDLVVEPVFLLRIECQSAAEKMQMLTLNTYCSKSVIYPSCHNCPAE